MTRMEAGRNDPCPCGSGKKYKKCCLAKTTAASRPPDPYSGGEFSRHDRDTALKKLIAFAYQPEFIQDVASADYIYWGGRLDDRSDEEAGWVMSLPQVQPNFHAWLLYDVPLDPTKTFTDLFLEREGACLKSGERAYLEKALCTHFRLYEVLDVEIDRGMRLRDLWDDQVYDILERSVTHALVRWDLLATRLMEVGTGNWVIDAGVFNYPQTAKEPILKELRAMHRRFRRKFPDLDDVVFFKRFAIFFNAWWLDWVAFRPLPRVVTPEGDETVPTRVYFDIVNQGAMLAGLRASPEIEVGEDGTFHWIEDTGEFRRALGILIPGKKRLVLETFSRERGVRGQQVINEACGDAVRYRLSRHEDLARAIDGRFDEGSLADEDIASRGRTQQEGPDIPPEVMATMKKEVMDRHYSGWIDHKIPALGDRTPRHAVKLKTVRPRLVELLKEMESDEERSALDGEPPYDFGWIWKELGLEGERR